MSELSAHFSFDDTPNDKWPMTIKAEDLEIKALTIPERSVGGEVVNVRYVPERTATRKVRSYGSTGTSQCSECERHIGRYDAFCKHCGARFTTTEYERV